MTSFEGMRARPGWGAREWRFTRYLSFTLAAIVASAALSAGLEAASSGETSAPAPRTYEPAIATAPGPISLQPPAPVLAPAFTLELPTAFTDNFELPPPPPAPEPEPAPVLQAAPAPAAPSANPPAATKPVEQPKPAPPAPAPAPAEKPNFYVPAVSGGGATNLEQRLLDGINAQRSAAGLAPYAYDAGLTRVARTRSQQMIDQGYFAHVDPYGYSMYTALLQHFGIRYAWAGENLALNNYSLAESPELALQALMNSPSHAANILSSAFSRIGVGEVTAADGRRIYAMIFVG